MFINSSLIDQNPYETTSSYIEDETIQLINYYGRQLIEYLDEDKNIKHKVRDIKDHMAHHHVKTQQNHIKIDHVVAKPAIAQPILTFHKTVQIPIPQTVDLDQSETKRQYQIEKLKLTETVNKVQNRIAKPTYKDPYPIAQKTAKKTSPIKKMRQSTTFVTEQRMQMPYGKPNEIRDRRLNKQFEAIREQLNLKQNKEPKLGVQEKQERLNDFMTRMEIDRRKRVEKSAKNAIQQMIKYESQEKTGERYRSTTPTSITKTPIREKIIRQKRKLEQQFARTSFSPDLIGLNPKFSRYYIQKTPENREPIQPPRQVIRLSNPQELQFLLNPTS